MAKVPDHIAADRASGGRLRRLAALADGIDRVNDGLGRALSWLTLALALLTAAVAVLRYLFATGWVWMQDAYLWIFGTMIFMGAAYTLLHDRHVRVDFLYNLRGRRFRAAVDLAGALIFLCPTIILLIWVTYPYVRLSWLRMETSLEAGGLPGVFLLKSVLLLFCLPLAAQGLSLAIRSLLVLLGYRPGQSDVRSGKAG